MEKPPAVPPPLGDEHDRPRDDRDVNRMESEGCAPPTEGARGGQVLRSRAITQLLPRARRRACGGLTVGDVMAKSVRSVTADSTIKDVAIVMAGDATGVVPVVTGENLLVGLVTDRDIVTRACAGDKSFEDMRAADAMTRDPSGIAADQPLSDALSAMARLQVQRLPVVDDDFRLVGMISIGDIASRNDASVDLRVALTALTNRKLLWNRAWR